MWHLDTSVVVAYLRGERNVAERLKACVPEVAISAIVLAELEFGARASKQPAPNLARLAEFTQIVPVLSFDAACAARYGEIRHQLRRSGNPIGDTDTLIAAAAMANQATLVTRNRRHFSRIDGLSLNEW